MELDLGWILIIILIVSVMGLSTALVGVDFYDKCQKNEKMSSLSKDFLKLELIVFITVTVMVGIVAAFTYKGAKRR